MNKQQIIDAAMQIATGVGTDQHTSPVIDGEMTAEDLLPLVFRHVYTDLLRANPMRMNDLLVEHTIPLVNGVGNLPPDIMIEWIEKSGALPDFPYSSLASPPDFKRQKFNNLLCYWTYDGDKFKTTCVTGDSGSEDDGSGSEESGEDIVFQAATIPSLPANASDEVQVDERDLDAIIYALALAIRGELKLVM